MTPDTFTLRRNDWMPNNPDLPVLHYRGALKTAGTAIPEAAEDLLGRNGWPARWRGGIFSYHHYHSTTHETLAVVGGAARVMLGGPEAQEVDLAAGDVVVLPAGTGHCLLDADPDFLVVGAYPGDQEWDIRREAPDDATLERIANVPRPERDPVDGADGHLVRLWSQPG